MKRNFLLETGSFNIPITKPAKSSDLGRCLIYLSVHWREASRPLENCNYCISRFNVSFRIPRVFNLRNSTWQLRILCSASSRTSNWHRCMHEKCHAMGFPFLIQHLDRAVWIWGIRLNVSRIQVLPLHWLHLVNLTTIGKLSRHMTGSFNYQNCRTGQKLAPDAAPTLSISYASFVHQCLSLAWSVWAMRWSIRFHNPCRDAAADLSLMQNFWLPSLKRNRSYVSSQTFCYMYNAVEALLLARFLPSRTSLTCSRGRFMGMTEARLPII